MRKRTGMRTSKDQQVEVGDGEGPLLTKQQRAQAAMANRNKTAKKDAMTNYYFVIYAFVGICVLAIGLSLFSPKKKFDEIAAIDGSAIMVHNGLQYQFKQGANRLFEHKTLADAKPLFNNALSDSERNHICKTSKNTGEGDEDITVPESYDWRLKFPECVQPVLSIEKVANCTASYAYATISTSEDRICMKSHEKVRLSTQEILDCDVGNNGCTNGHVNKVLTFGQNKGFIVDECMEATHKRKECEVDHFENNQCRLENVVFKVQDFCLAAGEENIKREIIKNGPVVGQMQPYTDFLAYKDGVYHKTPDAKKFTGQHIVKIIGWGKAMDGSTEWIIENTWGSDWGENGYAKISSGKGDINIDGHAFGMLINHETQAEIMDKQNAPSPPASEAENPLEDLMQGSEEDEPAEESEESEEDSS